MTTRRSLSILAVVLLISVGGVALIYALRAQVPSTVVSLTLYPTPTVSPSVASSPTPVPTVAPSPASQQDAATAVRFADARRGWVGAAGGIYGTTDGGATWYHQLAAVQITWIRAVDATHAWAQSLNGAFYRTIDGARWDAVPASTPPVNEVFFISPLVGWAIAAPIFAGGAPQGPTPPPTPPVLLRTDDGGLTWRAAGTRSVASVCFANERDGYGVDGGQVLRTADGGQTWTVVFDVRHGEVGPWHPTVSCADGLRSARVQFTGTGAALGHAPYVVYRTADSGASWQLDFIEGYTLGRVFAAPPSTPQLGSYPSKLGSLGSGKTWFITCSPPVDVQSYLVVDTTGTTIAKGDVKTRGCSIDAQVIDERHVVAVSLKSVVATEDGGVTWKTIFTGPLPAGAIRLPQGFALPLECKNVDNGTAEGSATIWKVSCPQGLLSNSLRPSLEAQGWSSCGNKVWQKTSFQIAVTDAVNVSGFTGWLDQRPLGGSGCVQTTPPPN